MSFGLNRKECKIASRNAINKGITYARGMIPRGYVTRIGFSIYTHEEITAKGFLIDDEYIDRYSKVFSIEKSAEKGPRTETELRHTPRSPYLGTPQFKKSLCAYCNEGRYCPGHFGYIIFDKPYIPNPRYFDLINVILNVRCTNENIGEFSIERGIVINVVKTFKYEDRLPVLNTYVKGSKSCCDTCDKLVFTSNKEDGKAWFKVDGGEFTLSGVKILNILKNITVEDAVLMGLPIYRREDGSEYHKLTGLIMRSMSVPPNQLRPFQDSEREYQQKSQFSLLKKVIDARNSIRGSVGEQTDNVKNLYTAVSNWFDYIMDIQKGKKGTWRKMATADTRAGSRAVITGMTDIEGIPTSMIEIGVPRHIAEMDMIKVPITSENKEIWYYFLLLGKVRSIKRLSHNSFDPEDPTRITIHIKEKYLPDPETVASVSKIEDINNIEDSKGNNYKLKEGDIIYRQLLNGDFITGNRQPSLHYLSYMGHQVRIVEGVTFEVHPNAVSPYNGDFDGDQMTFAAPSVYEIINGKLRRTRVIEEVINRMFIVKNFITTKNGNPAFGLILDNVTSSFLMSLDDRLLPWDFVLMVIDYLMFPISEKDRGYIDFSKLTHEELIDFILKEKSIYPIHYDKTSDDMRSEFDDPLTRKFVEEWRRELKKFGIHERSPRAVLSLAFPRDFTYEVGDVRIINGILVRGILTKSYIGISQQSIFKYMFHDIGPYETVGSLDNLTMITTHYILHRGFSISFKDCDTPYDQEHAQKLAEIYDTMNKRVILAHRDIKNKLSREKIIMGIVNDADTKIMGLPIKERFYRGETSLRIMGEKAKSKGSKDNTTSITIRVGPQYIGSGKIPRNTPGDRTSVYQFPYDVVPTSNGYITSSFSLGLMPEELIEHAKGARQNMGDTAIGTPDVGTLARKIKVYSQNLISYPDGTVREQDIIIQFMYGQYGFNTINIYNDPTPVDPDHMFFMDMKHEINKLSLEKGWIYEEDKYNSTEGDIDDFILGVMKEEHPDIMFLEKLGPKIDIIEENFTTMLDYINEELTYTLNNIQYFETLNELMSMDYKDIIVSIFEPLLIDYINAGKLPPDSMMKVNEGIRNSSFDRNSYERILSRLKGIEEVELQKILKETTESLSEYIKFRNNISFYVYEVAKSIFDHIPFGEYIQYIDLNNRYDHHMDISEIMENRKEIESITVKSVNVNYSKIINILTIYAENLESEHYYAIKNRIVRSIYGRQLSLYYTKNTKIFKDTLMAGTKVSDILYKLEISFDPDRDIDVEVENKIDILKNILEDERLRVFMSGDQLPDDMMEDIEIVFTIQSMVTGGTMDMSEEFFKHMEDTRDSLIGYKGITMEKISKRLEELG